MKVEGGEGELDLAECHTWPVQWSGDPLAFDAGDGVCDCCMGAWDPDCESLDFSNAALDSSEFLCPLESEN